MVRNRNEIISILFGIIIMALGLILEKEKILVVSMMISMLIVGIKVRKNQLLLLISNFFFLYVIPPALHYFGGVGISAYTAFNSDTYYYMVLVCQTVFLFVFSSVLNSNQKRSIDNQMLIETFDIPLAYWFCVIGIIVTILIGRNGQSIFLRGGYGTVGAYSGSALFEYCYIFFSLAYIFSGGEKGRGIFLQFLAVLYTIKGVLFGARIEILAMLILVFILFYQNRFRTRTILLLTLCAYFALMIFGSFRSNLTFAFDGVGKLYGYSVTYNRIVNNESEVFYTSSVILASIKTGFIDFTYRLNALLNYLIRLVIPSSLVNGTYNVVPYLQANFSSNGGGGFFSAFLYFYLWWPGVVAGAVFAAEIWNRIGEIGTQTPEWQIFVNMSVVMTPRWFAYSPESIVKIPLYTVIGYECLKSVFILGLNQEGR